MKELQVCRFNLPDPFFWKGQVLTNKYTVIFTQAFDEGANPVQ